MKKTKPIKLRWHLVVLIVATLVPLLLFAAILIQQQIKQQQANAHRGLHDTALFRDLPRDVPIRLLPLWREWMAHGLVSGERFDGAWANVGTPSDLAALDAQLTESIATRQ